MKNKKKPVVKASVPRRVTVAGTEGKFRNIADAFAAAQAARSEAVTEVKGQISAYQTLLRNLEGLK